TALLVYNAVEQKDNPSTSFVLSNSVYKYPDTYVCLTYFFGCDDLDLDESCASSIFDTEGGSSSAVFNPGGELEQEIATTTCTFASVLPCLFQRGWCVFFETSAVDIVDGERDPEDYILLNMYWYPGGTANASTTCISEEGEWDSHSETVIVFLRDPDTGVLSAGIQVPYSCMTSESSSHVFTYMGIGLTKENKLYEDDTASYKALEISSATYKDKRTDNITGITSPYAWLSMEIAQSTDSLEEITEINPLEIAELFGNVGGFWDLLLLLWPIFFISASRQDPHLKGRNFKKSVTRGSDRVVDLTRRVNSAASLDLPYRLRRKAGDRQSNATDEDEERPPAWETGGTLPAYGQQDLSLRASSRGVPVESFPQSWRQRDGSPPDTAVPPHVSFTRSTSLGAATSMTSSAYLGQSESRLWKDTPSLASRSSFSSDGTVSEIGSSGRQLSADEGSAPVTY
ncbi:unnamed protein product, partial [Ectocarpus sp. 13 AM-2016]